MRFPRRLFFLSAASVWLFVLWKTYHTNCLESETRLSDSSNPPRFHIHHEHDQTNLSASNQCSPKTSLFYLRIQKTGSSTLTNIFYRYMLHHNLPIVPSMSENYYPSADIPDASLLVAPGQRPSFGLYHYFGDHITYNQSLTRRLLNADSVNVATMRHPLSNLRSVFREFGLHESLSQNHSDPLPAFLNNIKKLEVRGQGVSLSDNLYARAFGIYSGTVLSREEFSSRLSVINEQFLQVLITEYFDESLVLLRRRLCWKLQDILYIPHRVGWYRYNAQLLDYPTENKLLRHSWMDYSLYHSFVEKLFLDINREPDFWQELTKFKVMQDNARVFCEPYLKRWAGNDSYIYSLANDTAKLHLDSRPFGDEIFLRPMDCALMNFYTMTFRRVLMARDNPALCREPLVDSKLQKSGACGQIDDRYGVPLRAFENHWAMMFSFYIH